MAAKKKTKIKSSIPKKSGSRGSSGGASRVDKALADYEKHDKMVTHHRNKRDLAEAKIKVAGHEIQHVYPGESPRAVMGKPKIKLVKVSTE